MENTNEIDEQDVQGNIKIIYDEDKNPMHLEYLEYNPKTNAYEYNYLCRFFAVILVLTNITTNEVLIKIRYLQAGVYMEKIINRSVISSQSFGSFLFSIGLDIDQKLISYAREAIFLSEEVAEHEYTFSKIGWHSMLGEVDYFLGKPLISDDEVQPTYEGYFNFSTKGTFEGWKSDFAPILQQNHYLATIFSTGLTAILIGYLNLVHDDIGSKLVDIDTMVVSLVGLTSKGKSISAQFCGGLYSSPYKSDNSIFSTTNFTNNFAVNMLSDNHGVLQIFDDTSSTKSLKEYSDLVYMLSQNQSRGRATKNYGGNSERASWSTLVMTTTEYSLSLLEDNRKGKFVRNLEFEFPYFTKSAEEADEIKRKLGNNYGVVAEVFAKAVFGIDKLELVEMYDECKILLLQKATIKDGLSDRIVGNIASILLSAKIAKDYMEMPINIEEITRVLLTVHDDGSTTRAETPTPLEFIKNFVAKNVANFNYHEICPKNFETVYNISERTPVYGNYIINQILKFSIFEIPRKTLEKILIEGGYANVNAILKEWKKEGVILTEKGKNTKKCVLNGQSVRCVVIKIENTLPTQFFKNSADNYSKRITQDDYEEMDDDDLI